MTEPIYSATLGDNSDVFADAAHLHLTPDMTVIDLTYGKGVFWRKLPEFTPWRNDIDRELRVYTWEDCRKTSWPDGFWDAAVLDLPYKLGTSHPMNPEHDCYGNNGRPEKGYRAVLQLHDDALREVARILRPKGLLFLKTQDQVESGRNWFLHIDVLDTAAQWGLFPKDLFVLVRKSKPVMRHDPAVTRQQHARKCHSFLWVLKKGD